MPTYTISAPNGKAYSITGPAGASDDDVRAQVLKQHPEAGTKASPSWMDTLGRAASNLPGAAADAVGSAISAPIGLVNAAMHPTETGQAISGWADQAAKIVGGGLQHIRDLSPVENQGTAPSMDTGAFDKTASDLHQQYMTEDGLKQTIGDHPLAPALAIAAILHPTLKATGAYDAMAPVIDRASAAITTPLKKAVAPITSAVAPVVSAGRNLATATSAMRSQTAADIAERLGSATDDAANATSTAAAESAKAADAAAQARRVKAKERALAARSASLAPATAKPDLAIGDPAYLSQSGDALREPAVVGQSDLNASMRAADDKYRAAMQQVADARAKEGVGVSDIPEAKDVIAKSEAVVNPDPATRPVVGNVPAASAGAKLHQELLSVLKPTTQALTAEEAKAAIAVGKPVNVTPGSRFTRASYSQTVKPSLQNIDDFRRKVGKVLNGTVEGYEGINRDTAGGMYQDLSNIIDKYSNGASRQVQDNWREGKAALAPYENVRTGQGVVGMQGDTGVPNVPASSLPGRMIAGGRDSVAATAAVSGQAPVTAVLRTQVQNALAGAKTSDAAAALVGPSTTLGDAIQSDPRLRNDVNEYLQKLRNSEDADNRAKGLSARAAAAAARAKELTGMSATASSAAGTATSAAEAAKALAREQERQFSLLKVADPKEVALQYKAMLDDARTSGKIGNRQYDAGVELAKRAQKSMQLKSTRDTWLRWAGRTLGIGAIGELGLVTARGH